MTGFSLQVILQSIGLLNPGNSLEIQVLSGSGRFIRANLVCGTGKGVIRDQYRLRRKQTNVDRAHCKGIDGNKLVLAGQQSAEKKFITATRSQEEKVINSAKSHSLNSI